MAQDLELGGVCAVEVGDHLAFAHHEDPRAQPAELLDLRRHDHHAEALVRQVRDDPVQLGLRRHVDAARGLVEQQDPAPTEQPTGQHHLLLVPAGELARQTLTVVGRGLQGSELILRSGALGSHAQEHPLEPPEVGQRDVLGQAPAEQQRLGLPVLGRQSQPGGDREVRAVRREAVAVDEHLTGISVVHPVDRAQAVRSGPRRPDRRSRAPRRREVRRTRP